MALDNLCDDVVAVTVLYLPCRSVSSGLGARTAAIAFRALGSSVLCHAGVESPAT